MDDKLTFGKFITQKRLEKEIPLRRFAAMLKISPEHLCNFEKGRKAAPKIEVLEKIAELLLLGKEETEQMYNLAAESKKSVESIPSDLSSFINKNDIVIAALRMAKDVDADDKEWIAFMEKLKKIKGADK